MEDELNLSQIECIVVKFVSIRNLIFNLFLCNYLINRMYKFMFLFSDNSIE